MKKIAADRNYRMFKGAQWRIPGISRLADWILEETGITAKIRKGMPEAAKAFRLLVDSRLTERARKSKRPGETAQDAYEREYMSALLKEFAPGVEAAMEKEIQKQISKLTLR